MPKFYLIIDDPEATEESLEADVQNFREALTQQQGVSGVDVVTESDVPDGAKGLGAAIAGFLSMEITLEGVKALIPTLGEMAMGRGIEIVREKPDGTKLSVKVGQAKDLVAVKDFLDGLDAE